MGLRRREITLKLASSGNLENYPFDLCPKNSAGRMAEFPSQSRSLPANQTDRHASRQRGRFQISLLPCRFFVAFGVGNANFIPNMPDEHQPDLNQPGPRKRSASRRRGRRGGRGRSLRPSHATAPPNAGPSPAGSEPPHPTEEYATATTGAQEHPLERPQPLQRPAYKPRHEQPAASPLGRALDEVRRIVESLEEALEQMEQVLELVELAEEQKIADEREIENLRRALRRIQMPRHEPQRERRPEHPREEISRERGEPEERVRDELPPPSAPNEPEPETGNETHTEDFGPEEQNR